MNKMLEPTFPRLSDKAALRLIGQPVPFAGRKAKEETRKAFRAERKARIADKRSWLES